MIIVRSSRVTYSIFAVLLILFEWGVTSSWIYGAKIEGTEPPLFNLVQALPDILTVLAWSFSAIIVIPVGFLISGMNSLWPLVEPPSPFYHYRYYLVVVPYFALLSLLLSTLTRKVWRQ